MYNAAAPSLWDVGFFLRRGNDRNKNTIFHSLVVQKQWSSGVHRQLEVTVVSVMGAGQWHFWKGTARLFLKWHLLSVSTLSFGPSLAPPVTHSIKGGQQISEISFSLSLKEINSGFRWFSCRSTRDSWRAVGVRWPSSLSSLSLCHDFLRPPEHTQSPSHFIAAISKQQHGLSG